MWCVCVVRVCVCVVLCVWVCVWCTSSARVCGACVMRVCGAYVRGVCAIHVCGACVLILTLSVQEVWRVEGADKRSPKI